MEQRGQMQLSFGMIFSIIIIVVTLAVCGYVLFKFLLPVNTTISCETFFDDIQTRINTAWAGDGATQDTIIMSVPSGTQKVCFGNLSLTSDVRDRAVLEELRSKVYEKSNINLYAGEKKVCGQAESFKTLKHVYVGKFFCSDVNRDGKVSFTISKSITEAQVTIKP